MNKTTVVHFHIGRGGSFRHAGYKEFKGVEDMTPSEYCSVIDTDEDGNPLPDDDGRWWTMVEDSSERVLLQGRENIMSRTGTLDYDGDYDKDVYKYVEDCDEDELLLLRQAVERNSVDAMGLTYDDIEYIRENA